MKSEAIGQLAAALSKFQAKQSPIKFNSKNPFLKNDYADLTALIEGTKISLGEHGLAVSQLLGDNSITTMLMHESGEYICSEMKFETFESKGTNPAQQLGIIITYSRRYAYAAILGLVTDRDTDGHIRQTNQAGKPSAVPDKAQMARYQKFAVEQINNFHKNKQLSDDEKTTWLTAISKATSAQEIKDFMDKNKKEKGLK